MPQKQDGIKPIFIDTDTDLSELKPNQAAYMKSVQWDVSGNPNNAIGTNNPTGEGQNLLALSTTRSNQIIRSPRSSKLDGWMASRRFSRRHWA